MTALLENIAMTGIRRMFKVVRRDWVQAALVTCCIATRLYYVLAHVNDHWLSVGADFAQLDLAHSLLHGNPVFVYGSSFNWDAYRASPNRPFDTFVTGFNSSQPPFINELCGYSFLVASIWLLAGSETVLSIQIFQLSLDVMTLLVVYHISLCLFSKRVALLASTLYIITPLAIEVANWIQPRSIIGTPLFFTFQPYRDFYPLYSSAALVAILLRTRRASSNAEYSDYVLFGLTFALSVWVRQTIIFLPLFLAIYVIREQGWLEALKMLFIAYGILSVTLLPWVVRNYAIYRQFIPLSAGVGHWWYIGFGEIDNPWNITYSDEEGAMKVAQIVAERGLNSSDLNLQYVQPGYQALLTEEVFNMVLEKPIFYSYLLGLRALSGLTLGTLTPRRLQSIFQGQMFDYRATTVAIGLAVGALVLYESFKREEAEGPILLLMLVPIGFLLSFLPFQMAFRYMYPCSWAYMILASFGVETLWLKVKKS